MGVVLVKHRSESQWTVLLGYLSISTDVRCYYRIVYNNFIFQQVSALVDLAFNAVELLQYFHLSYGLITVQSLTPLCDLESRIAARAFVASNKTE